MCLAILTIQSSCYAIVTGYVYNPRGEMTDMSSVAGESVHPTKAQKLEDRIALASKNRYH